MSQEISGLLSGACGYLSGPMEYVSDHGIVWRRKFIELSYQSGLKVDYIDPTNKPGGNMQIKEDKEYQKQLREEGRYQELKEYVSNYRRLDLRFTDISDFVVAVVNPNVPQWGTSDECYTAEDQHKPIFWIIDGGLKKLPFWLFDVAELNMVFDSVEAVIEKLIRLDTGLEKMTNEWVLVRKAIEERRQERKRYMQELSSGLADFGP